ncbi:MULTISPECIES: benzoylformate decarboxylase [Acinetobacter]|uniref:benzoylformate decarboxylase n=1 Tax=Acinetobacter TaxID=469 RepID=UPI000BF689BD|nr:MULTISPECIES: benzoylformate decarboxylase [Acinetobacter]MDC5293925.1 benzoylformate decarboxylase [Acinetobacter baumannii]RSQ66200.1 benzoylformate decarboxylase [Acinetobacter baumannii]
MKTVHQYTYEILRKNKITTVFGNPGSNELPFLKNFPTDFQYILGLHEGTVVGIADGYAQATGQPAFVNLHSAAGTGNAMGALSNAWNSHTPLVITSGQQTRTMMGVEALLTNIEATQLPKPLVKWSHEPASANEVPHAISRAINISKAEAAGPVYVSIPYNDWDVEIDEQNEHLLTKNVVSSQGLSNNDLNLVANKINSAKHVAVVFGTDVDRQYANESAVKFVESLRAPVWIAPSSPRCPFPTTHAYFQGILPASIGGISTIFENYDLVLVFGAPVFRYHQYEPGKYIGENTELLAFTCDIQEAARAPIGTNFICDLEDCLSKLVDLVKPKNITVPPRKTVEPASSTEGYIKPERLFDLINSLAPDNTIFTNESTSTTNILWERLSLTEQGSYFFAAAGGLGFGMPAAVGIQLAHSERRVVAIIGDGSANYSITALWTAAQYKIPVIFIILKNGTYGALRWFASVLKADNVPGMDVPDIDFTQIAKGYGVEAFNVNQDDDFISKFNQALSSDKPTLIEVLTADCQ